MLTPAKKALESKPSGRLMPGGPHEFPWSRKTASVQEIPRRRKGTGGVEESNKGIVGVGHPGKTAEKVKEDKDWSPGLWTNLGSKKETLRPRGRSKTGKEGGKPHHLHHL